MHARLHGSKSFLTLYQIVNKTDFSALADEIAEPHPDMNIKVAAFTVSEKSSNTVTISTQCRSKWVCLETYINDGHSLFYLYCTPAPCCL